MKQWRILFFIFCLVFLTSCGFHLRGETPLAKPLHNLYIKTRTPYGDLTENLRTYLKMSHVNLAETPHEASTVLEIISETTTQQLLGVNLSQQTRQYNLILAVTFQITTPDGEIIMPPRTVTENRALSINTSQILAGSNQAAALTQDMRRMIVFDIMNVLSSKIVSHEVTAKTLNEN